jgi:microcystin-dependent protein
VATGAAGGTLNTTPIVFYQASSATPIGALQVFAGAAAPYGWLLCQGQAVSRALYARLYAVIGTTYGAGDGSTTFAVPDLRGRTIFGVDAGAGRLTGAATGGFNATLGATGGEQSHQITANEVGSHAHGNQHQHHMAGHNHDLSNHAHYMNHQHGLGGHAHYFSVTSDTEPNHRHTVPWAGASGAGSAAFMGSNMNSSSLNSGLGGQHSHVVAGWTGGPNTASDWTRDWTDGPNNNGSGGSWAVTGWQSENDNGRGGNTDPAGGNAGHNTIPPGIALNYLIYAGI